MFGSVFKLAGCVADVATRPLRDSISVAEGLTKGELRIRPASRLAGASMVDDSVGLALDALDVLSAMTIDD